jgi:chemotaxis protein methyltransferase CheR
LLRQGALHCVRDHYKQAVMVARHDIRAPPPHGPFDLVMCRNLAFTYVNRDLQRATAARLADVLKPGGALVLGSYEALPRYLPRLRAVERSSPGLSTRRHLEPTGRLLRVTGVIVDTHG